MNTDFPAPFAIFAIFAVSPSVFSQFLPILGRFSPFLPFLKARRPRIQTGRKGNQSPLAQLAPFACPAVLKARSPTGRAVAVLLSCPPQLEADRVEAGCSVGPGADRAGCTVGPGADRAGCSGCLEPGRPRPASFLCIIFIFREIPATGPPQAGKRASAFFVVETGCFFAPLVKISVFLPHFGHFGPFFGGFLVPRLVPHSLWRRGKPCAKRDSPFFLHRRIGPIFTA